MAWWLSFFAEYNFTVIDKPVKQSVLADALSRRPDYELGHPAYIESPLYELIQKAYTDNDDLGVYRQRGDSRQVRRVHGTAAVAFAPLLGSRLLPNRRVMNLE
ncbi:hypothetical protein PF003_g6030 [Phytophthora fragariae]|nr:hypothetical protein PF003_g6030 [Phytophthora fragariae]